MKLLLTIIFGMLVAVTSFAASKIISANSFTVVTKLIEENKDPHHLLLAMDDDDTLTMMPCPSPSNCQHLGGPEWYIWQSKLPPNHKDRIWNNIKQLKAINTLIFAASEMILTDPEIHNTLNLADKKGVPIIAATGRDYSKISATERQFEQDHIFHYFTKNALRTSLGQNGFTDYYFPQAFNNQPVLLIAYLHGIYYMDLQNKGVMIKQLLEKTKQSQQIHDIIFIDDIYQNVVDVANAFKDDPHVNVISIHYTRLAAIKKAFLTGNNAKELQSLANQQWFAIAETLKKRLLGFSIYF